MDVPADTVGIAIGATAVGALTLGSGFMILRSLNPPPKATPQSIEESEEQEQQEQLPTGQLPGSEEVTYICVNSSELEEIKQLLVANRKRFIVNRTYSPHST